MSSKDQAPTSLQRGLAILRALAATDGRGARLTDLAAATGLTQATLHRLLRTLVADGIAEQTDGRLYRLSVEFFALAARAANPEGLREIVRPGLLRLSSSLNDTIFLFVRSGYDALCLDRCEGPFPIRS